MALSKQQSDQNPKSLRISIDSKAKVKIGDFSRNGYERNIKPEKTLDHDYSPKAVLVPFGILDVLTDQLWIYFGQSKETSDFIVDCLQLWWKANNNHYNQIEELMIELDGGSAVRSNRTQFIKRIVEFALAWKLKIRLVYYPPYHSKYNTIERCWACLENYWNGAVLETIEKALNWASNMTWRGIKPKIKLIEGDYQKGVKPSKEKLESYQKYWNASPALPSWDIRINPKV